MGYFYHLAAVSCKRVLAIQNLTPAELKLYVQREAPSIFRAKDDTFYFEELFRDLLSLGRGCEYDFCEHGRPLFNCPETYMQYEYFKPFVVGRQALEAVIDCLQQQVVEGYQELLREDCRRSVPEIKSSPCHLYVLEQFREWKNGDLLNKKKDRRAKCLTFSYAPEYRIFDYLRVYHDIDWNHEMAVFYGE